MIHTYEKTHEHTLGNRVMFYCYFSEMIRIDQPSLGNVGFIQNLSALTGLKLNVLVNKTLLHTVLMIHVC